MATGIKDKVAILGMGCSKFGERWDASPEDLMVEAYTEALKDAGISPEQIDAAWYSTHMDDVGTGRGGTPMAIALRLPNIGVTRVENFCAGGTEAVRAERMRSEPSAIRISTSAPWPTRLAGKPAIPSSTVNATPASVEAKAWATLASR